MHHRIFSAATIGIKAQLVEVEVDVSLGLVNFFIVGLPDTAVKESSKRIQTALKNSGVRLPAKRITVNLAPADLKKVGTLFDLPIAVGILYASGLLEPSSLLDDAIFIGELSLDGHIRPVRGALAIALDAQATGKRRLIVPKANAAEASLAPEIIVIGVSHIVELIEYLKGERSIEAEQRRLPNHIAQAKASGVLLDFSQVTGQRQAKHALAIAAAGRHNILFVGPPGAGKTMLAKRLTTIMPPMSEQEILSTSKIYSVCGTISDTALVVNRPFCSPHHTISQGGLIGGGSVPQPGQISLAHNGILFLDEFTEFKTQTLEAMRQPLESKCVTISRVQQTVSFPADFLLIAALNPCPCGYWGDKNRDCSCSARQIKKYFGKISGPLLDRIDLQVGVQSIAFKQINDNTQEPISSKELQKMIQPALEAQEKRFGSNMMFNSRMSSTQVKKFCVVTPKAQLLIEKAFVKLHLSMRGYHKVLRVARTIADMYGVETIDVPQVRSALLYRGIEQHLDRAGV